VHAHRRRSVDRIDQHGKKTQYSSASSSSKTVSPPSAALFGRRKYVSVRGLAAVLDEIKQHGMPDSVSRSGIKRARDKEFNANTKTPYGQVIGSSNIGVSTSGETLEF